MTFGRSTVSWKLHSGLVSDLLSEIGLWPQVMISASVFKQRADNKQNQLVLMVVSALMVAASFWKPGK
jgi:hypothetical protein